MELRQPGGMGRALIGQREGGSMGFHGTKENVEARQPKHCQFAQDGAQGVRKPPILGRL